MIRIARLNPHVGCTSLAVFLLSIAGALGCVGAHAEEQTGSGASGQFVIARSELADLERAFWECDYAVTTSGVSLGEGAWCVEITDEVKRRKFAGDFEAMLGWWQRHKTDEHRALAVRQAEIRAPASSGVPR
jgi:hypothetical protein